MAINKIEFGGNVLLDLSNDTLTAPNQIKQGVVGHLRDGTQVTGTYQGSGSSNFETGTLELTSDFSLTTSAKKITGLQLSFKPDYFMLTPDRASFEARGSYSGGLWELIAFKKSLFAPYAQSSSISPEAVTTNDYGFFYRASVSSNSSVSCGYGLGGESFLGQNYYSRYAVNDDGTISVGRYSSASTKIFAGKYRYIAIKF